MTRQAEARLPVTAAVRVLRDQGVAFTHHPYDDLVRVLHPTLVDVAIGGPA